MIPAARSRTAHLAAGAAVFTLALTAVATPATADAGVVCAFDLYAPEPATVYASAEDATAGTTQIGETVGDALLCGASLEGDAYEISQLSGSGFEFGPESGYVRASSIVELPAGWGTPDYAEWRAVTAGQGTFGGVKAATIHPWPTTGTDGAELTPGTVVAVDPDLQAHDGTDPFLERTWLAVQLEATGVEGWVDARQLAPVGSVPAPDVTEAPVPADTPTPEPTRTPTAYTPAPSTQPTPDTTDAPTEAGTARKPGIPWLLVGPLLAALGIGWWVRRRTTRTQPDIDDATSETEDSV